MSQNPEKTAKNIKKKTKNVLNGEKTRQKCGKKSQNIAKPGENHKI